MSLSLRSYRRPELRDNSPSVARLRTSLHSRLPHDEVREVAIRVVANPQPDSATLPRGRRLDVEDPAAIDEGANARSADLHMQVHPLVCSWRRDERRLELAGVLGSQALPG